MADQHSKILSAYQEEKLSEMQISRNLGIAPKIVRRVLDKNKIKRRSRSEAAYQYHVTEHNKKEFQIKELLTQEDTFLKLAAIMLYWGEGTKKGNGVALCNSDPGMIRIFTRFLRDICGVDETRLHVTVHYYEDQNPEELIDFWSVITSIPKSQFYRPYLHRHRGGTYRDLSKYGTASVQYSDKRLLEVIKAWIQEYNSQLGETTS